MRALTLVSIYVFGPVAEPGQLNPAQFNVTNSVAITSANSQVALVGDFTGNVSLPANPTFIDSYATIQNPTSPLNTFTVGDGNTSSTIFVPQSGTGTGPVSGLNVTINPQGQLNLDAATDSTFTLNGNQTNGTAGLFYGTLSGDTSINSAYGIVNGGDGTLDTTGTVALTDGSFLYLDGPDAPAGPQTVGALTVANSTLEPFDSATINGPVTLQGYDYINQSNPGGNSGFTPPGGISTTLTLTGSVTPSGATTIDVAGGTLLDIQGQLQGSSNLTLKDLSGIGPGGPPTDLGPGTIELDQNSSGFSGNVTLVNGTLELGNGGALGTGVFDIQNGLDQLGNAVPTTVTTTGAAPISISTDTDFDGTFTLGSASGAALTFADPVSDVSDSTVTIAGPQVDLSGGFSGSAALTVAGNPLMFQGNTDIYAGNLVDQGTVEVASGETLTLNGTNTVDGTFTVADGGDVQDAGAVNVDGGQMNVNTGSTFDVNGGQFTEDATSTTTVDGSVYVADAGAVMTAGVVNLDGGYLEVDANSSATASGSTAQFAEGHLSRVVDAQTGHLDFTTGAFMTVDSSSSISADGSGAQIMYGSLTRGTVAGTCALSFRCTIPRSGGGQLHPQRRPIHAGRHLHHQRGREFLPRGLGCRVDRRGGEPQRRIPGSGLR